VHNRQVSGTPSRHARGQDRKPEAKSNKQINKQTSRKTSKRISKRMSKSKKKVFSVVKAIKSNARDRVGSPPPERILPDPKQKLAARPKHKETLSDLLDKQGAED
jgi:hypothetical protein